MTETNNISTEAAFDALPYVMEVYDKLDLDSYRKKVSKQYKVKNTKKPDLTEVGIDLFKYVLKNISKAKEEIFSVIAIFENKTPEQVKAQPIAETIKSLRTVFQDKEVMDFFKESME